MDARDLTSTIVDQALMVELTPLACPCDFGPENRFRLEEIIGIGARSVVYRGVDTKLSTDGHAEVVAIKVARFADAGIIDARAARRVTHNNVVRVHDLGVDPGTNSGYVVMEHIAGGDLSQVEPPMEPRKAARLVSSLARGVQAAHGAGVVHCDLKPANVLLTMSGEPKLADFDLSLSPANPDASARGNRAFMAPEQSQGGDLGLTPLADVYALGGILRWLLTGELLTPVAADAGAAARAGFSRKIPRDLVQICRRALQPEPAQRFASAQAMADDLDRWLDRRPLDWTKPSSTRRVMLFLRRNPVASSIAILLLSLLGVTIDIMEQRHIDYVRAQQKAAGDEAVRMAKLELANIKARARQSLYGIMRSMGFPSPSPDDTFFPCYIFWAEMSNSELLDDKGRRAMMIAREDQTRSFLRFAQEEHRPDDSNIIFARLALAQMLLRKEEPQEALLQLDLVSKWCEGRLPETDPIPKCVRLLRGVADYETSPKDEPAGGPAQAALQQEIDKVKDDPSCTAARLTASNAIARRHPNPPSPPNAP